MSANASAVSVRLEPSSSGQTAHDLRLGPQPEYVNAARSKLNRVLISPLTNNNLRDEWERIKKAVGKKGKLRSNQNLSYAGIITFGTEAQRIFEGLAADRQDMALHEVADKVAGRFGTKLTGLVVHLDESALHAHFQLRGISNNGTVLSSQVKRGALRDVQTIAAEVMGRHATGIERGKNKWKRIEEGEDYAATVNRSVRQLHDDLPKEIAEREAALVEVQARLQTNLDRLAKAREQANAEGAKAEKARKNLEIYERRAETARAEMEHLEAAQRAYEANLARGREEGRQEGLKEIKDAREAAQALAGGEIELTHLKPLAAKIRTASIEAEETNHHESRNAHLRTSYTQLASDEWRAALQLYQRNVGSDEWGDLATSIKAAHEIGLAALKEQSHAKTGSLVDRVLAMVRCIANYWNGIAQAFVENLGDRIPKDIVVKGIMASTVPRAANEYGCLRPFVEEAQQEVKALDIAAQLVARSDLSRQ